MALNWKVAAAGGAVLGLGIGGFTIAGADGADTQPVGDADLQSAQDSIASVSAPVHIAPDVPTESDVESAPEVDDVESAASPVAPAPEVDVAEDSVDTPEPVAEAVVPVAPEFDDSASPVQPTVTDDVESVDEPDDAESVDEPDDAESVDDADDSA